MPLRRPAPHLPLAPRQTPLTECFVPDARNTLSPMDSVELKFARLRPLDAHLLSASSRAAHVRKAFRA